MYICIYSLPKRNKTTVFSSLNLTMAGFDNRPESATEPTKTQLASWTQNFNLIDKNGDGKVCKDEFKKCLQSCGNNPTDQEIESIMKKYDKDGNGEVTFQEFCEVMKERLKENEQDLRDAFKLFDKDNDGHLSVEELSDILFKKGTDKLCEDDREELQEMFEEADLDHDGKISIEEYVLFMTTPI